MNTKKKVITSLSILSVTIIAAIVSIIGVLALLDTSFNFGGSISFSATSIHATVSQATISGGSVTDETKLQEIKFDANQEGYDLEGAINSWNGLSLNFNENGDDVAVKFTVTNHSEQDKLRLTIGELTGTCNNATMSIALTEGLDGVTTMVLDETTGESTAVIDKAVAGTSVTEYSAEIVITFHITDKNKDASITNFNIPISLTEFDGYYVKLTIAEDVEYTFEGTVTTWTGFLLVKTDLDDDATSVSIGSHYLGKGNSSLTISTPQWFFNYIVLEDVRDGTTMNLGYEYSQLKEFSMQLTKDVQLKVIEISMHSGGGL